jgi:hypothetical protein
MFCVVVSMGTISKIKNNERSLESLVRKEYEKSAHIDSFQRSREFGCQEMSPKAFVNMYDFVRVVSISSAKL